MSEPDPTIVLIVPAASPAPRIARASIGLTAATGLARERQKQTLVDLLMLPGPRRDLLRAKAVGALVAERAKAAGIEKVVFDRGGNAYAGRIAALADSARENGLDF